MTLKAALIKYIHQVAFIPPKITLIKSINNKQLLACPGFTSLTVQKDIPDYSPGTDKGHIKINKQGIHSTKEKIITALESIETYSDLNLQMVT